MRAILNRSRELPQCVMEEARMNTGLPDYDFPSMVVQKRAISYPNVRAKRCASTSRPRKKQLATFHNNLSIKRAIEIVEVV
jgi:hypothetical protein